MASAFEIYLRTGRRVTGPAVLETKFNPWHDPEDGRFTFAGQGRYFGSTRARSRSDNNGFGGGGSFGGGGAGGSWSENSPHSFRGGSSGGGGATGSWPPPAQRPSPKRGSPRLATTSESVRRSAPVRSEPRLTVRKNGYEFSIDAHARPRRVSGQLRLQPQSRSRRAQANAGKPDRRGTDDGGHFIAARFNGPREWFNHFAQDANFNRGVYRVLEDRWAKAVRAGKRVFVDIVPHYRGTSMRPYKLIVTSIIDGKRRVADFPNETQGR